MKVAELRVALRDFPQDAEVAIYTDEPGALEGSAEFLQVITQDHLELEESESNTAGLAVPVLFISLSAEENRLA